MSDNRAVDDLANKIEAVINNVIDEWDICTAEVIGVLCLARARVERDALNYEDEQGDVDDI